MRGLAWFLLPALCAAGQELVVQGTVTHAITHEPLSGVQVRLVLYRNPDMLEPEAFGAQSDRAGHFEVGGIKPGRYMVLPTLRGFVPVPSKSAEDPRASMLLIKSGVNQNLHIEMAPHAVITGRVLDGDGEPVRQVMVQLERVDDSGPNAMPGGRAQTDDRGIFRLVCAPGRFYVKGTFFETPPPEKRTDGSAPFRPVPTYHPAAATRDSAVAVEARAGAETGGIDIRMGGSGAAGRSYAISGVITGIPEERGDRTPQLTVRERSPNIGNARGYQVANDGTFRAEGFAPGTYELFASCGDAIFPGRKITITDADVTNLELRLLSPITVTGRVVVKGDPPGPLKDKWKVGFQPADTAPYFGRSPRGEEVSADGAFQLAGVSPVGVWARLITHPEGTCIASLKVDGSEVRPNDVLNFQRANPEVVVTAIRNCGAISGVVKAADGAVLQDAMGYVLLMADPSRLDFINMSRWRVPIGAGGKFKFQDLSPGRYRVVAMETAPSAVWFTEEFRKVAARQKELDVKEGDRLAIEVRVIPREEIDGKK